MEYKYSIIDFLLFVYRSIEQQIGYISDVRAPTYDAKSLRSVCFDKKLRS